MNNFQVTAKEDNKKYWISRAIAVTGIVINTNTKTGVRSILANKRGKGTPDFQCYWNMPCGYLDFDETLQEATKREVMEETGFCIEATQFQLYGINDDPKENHQNVTARFIAKVYDKENVTLWPIGGEEDEVEEVKWIPLCNIDEYSWAFNHYSILRELL